MSDVTMTGRINFRNPDVLKEYSLLLRAVSTQVSATGMLYLAADLLGDSDTPEVKHANIMICAMVAGLLGMREAEPDLVERVLRNLPEQE